MGKNSKEIEIEGDFDLYSDTVREAQRAYRSKEWDKFKKVFDHNKEDMVKDFDLLGNTAINMAARSDTPEILKEFLGNLSEDERRRALRKKNIQGNIILHDIAVNCKVVEMADIILDLEKTTPPLPQEEDEKRRPLVEWKNLKGETPVFKAAKFGNLKMLSHLVKRVEGDMKIHLESSRESILHASINCRSFDVALWIIMNMNRSSLLGKKNELELTCIQLLVRIPRAFKSHYDPQKWKTITKLIYKWLPDEGYDIEGCDSFELLRPPVRDLETGGQHHARPPTPGHLLRANYTVWKYLAQVFKWIESVWEEKKKHQLADRLAEYLVRCDYTWQKSYYDEGRDKTVVKLPPILYNVAKRKQELRWKRKRKVMEDREEEDRVLERYKDYTPMLKAASNGITEVIHWYMKEHPDSINHVTEGGENILHIAIKHRQEEILEWLEDQPELPLLASQVNIKNRTALHQAARTDYYRGSPLPGAAFQLQKELEWYHRVEKIVPQHLHLHCDTDVLTAGDLLDVEHDQMLADAQKWIKETAQSCSTVAVLVATVVFAAAYTIPNGITSSKDKESDSARLFKSPIFIFFTVMDIVALAFSLASVVMFLSILNAPFELWDFHKSLPRKLSVGFTFLFMSLTTTMLSFSATILITIQLQWKGWTSTLVYGAALFPVSVFALIEFPLYKKIPRLFTKLRLFKKKNNSIDRP